MRVFARVDTAEFLRTVRALRAAAGPAMREALKDLGAPRIRLAESEVRRRAYDTGRYARALALAHNMLGRGVLTPTPIRRSRYNRQNLDRFRAILADIERREAFFERERVALERAGHAHWKRHAEVVRKLARLRKVGDRMADNIRRIDAEPDAIVIGSRGAARGRDRLGLARVPQVITRFYGATASVIDLNESVAALELVVREPHARLVERRTGIIRQSLLGAAPTGRHEALRRFVREMAARAGVPGAVREAA